MTERPVTGEITVLLRAAADGDRDSENRVFELLYDELHRLAHLQLNRHGPGRALDTTELIHEAYVKISKRQVENWAGQGHFLCLAARAMRQILVDHAREQTRLKRGGGAHNKTLRNDHAAVDHQIDQVLAVDQALTAITDLDPRMTAVVECKYFAGFTEGETATALGLSERTIRRLWVQAKTQLRKELEG
jgi:RNA polymerase sigma factor (TIGR02999 family)